MTGERLRGGRVAELIRRERLIVILRRIEPQARLLALVDELIEAGARIFEVTFDAASAADDLRAVRQTLGSGLESDSFAVGAGTLVSDSQLAAAVAAGADFGVSPLLDPPLIRGAIEGELPFVPGAFSPTEIAAAWAMGATFVKLFPASAVGPEFVRELRGPLPEVQLIPTGGLDATSAAAFLEAGAVAVGLGGVIIRAERAVRRRIVAGITGRPAESS